MRTTVTDQQNLYSKSDGIRELEPLQASSSSIPEVAPLSPEVAMVVPAGYTKTAGTIEIPTFIVIFSGGEKRERDYFSVIENNKDKFPRIKFEFLCTSEVPIIDPETQIVIKKNESGFSPDKLWLFAKHWLDERYLKNEAGQIEPIDNVYMLSDVDHFLVELLRVKPLCDAAKINLIISNSCFEKWLYYGYYSVKPHLNPDLAFSCPAEAKEISDRFKKYANELIPGGLKPKKDIFRLWDAIPNSIANHDVDKLGIPKLYSTNMFELGEDLLNLIGEDLKKLSIEYGS